jgi:hypothetical protein
VGTREDTGAKALGVTDRAPLSQLPQITFVQDRPNLLPISHAQAYWLSADGVPLSDARVPLLMRLRGRLNVRALEQALGDVIQRHAVLRARYLKHSGEIFQEILPSSGFALKRRTMTSLQPDQREEGVWDQMNWEFHAPESTNEAMLALTLFDMDRGDYLLGGFIHHVAFDRASLGVFWNSVFSGYYARCLGLAARPAPALQYADFALWESRWVNRAQSADFWNRYLAEKAPQFTLPVPQRWDRIVTLPFNMPDEVFAGLSEFARRHRSTLNHVFMAGVSAALRDHPDLGGSPLAFFIRARLPRTEDLLGSFAQLRVMKVQMGDNLSFGELVAKVKTAFRETTMLDRPLPASILKGRGLDRVVVNFSVSPAANASNARQPKLGLSIEHHQFSKGFRTETNRTIQFAVEQHQGGIVGQITYSSRLSQADALEIARRLNAVLALGPAAPDKRLSDLLDEAAGAG